MLRKLLKYDLRNMFKFLSFFYVLYLFFAITTRIFFNLGDTTILYIIGQISVGCFFAMLANILINTLMRNWVRFNESLFKDESYLTHTLPVSRKKLYVDKFLVGLITVTVSFLVIVIGLFITYYTKERWIMLEEVLNNMGLVYDINTTFMVILLLLVVFLEFFTGLQAGFIGLIIGNRKDNNKILWSIVYGLIIYFGAQLIVVFGIFILGLFKDDVMKLFINNTPSVDTIKLIMYMAIIIYIGVTFGLKILGIKELEKGVNVV